MKRVAFLLMGLAMLAVATAKNDGPGHPYRGIYP